MITQAIMSLQTVNKVVTDKTDRVVRRITTKVVIRQVGGVMQMEAAGKDKILLLLMKEQFVQLLCVATLKTNLNNPNLKIITTMTTTNRNVLA